MWTLKNIQSDKEKDINCIKQTSRYSDKAILTLYSFFSFCSIWSPSIRFPSWSIPSLFKARYRWNEIEIESSTRISFSIDSANEIPFSGKLLFSVISRCRIRLYNQLTKIDNEDGLWLMVIGIKVPKNGWVSFTDNWKCYEYYSVW